MRVAGMTLHLSRRADRVPRVLLFDTIQVNIGRFSADVGRIECVERRADVTLTVAAMSTIVLLCVGFPVTLIVICVVHARRRRRALRKWKTKPDVSYVHVPRSASIGPASDAWSPAVSGVGDLPSGVVMQSSAFGVGINCHSGILHSVVTHLSSYSRKISRF